MELFIVFSIALGALAAKAVVALFILFLMLRYADKKRGINFADVLEKLNEDPQALAKYYGARVRAAAIVVAGISIGSLL